MEVGIPGRLGIVIVLVVFGSLILGTTAAEKRGRWNVHGSIGLFIAATSTVLTFFHVEPVATFHNAIAWTGYILFADAMVFLIRGESLLCTYIGRFLYLLLVSFPIYGVFEAYNAFATLGWEYSYSVSHPSWRLILFGWGWIQVVPSLIETAWWLDALKPFRDGDRPAITVTKRWLVAISTFGFAMAAVPFLAERETIVRLFPPLGSLMYYSFMFVGPVMFLDPINDLRGRRSFLNNLKDGCWEPLLTFSVGGLVCGFIWEGWNYQATGRWMYPLLSFSEYKVFELPLPFFLYYMPFTIACMAMVECMTPKELSIFGKVWTGRG